MKDHDSVCHCCPAVPLSQIFCPVVGDAMWLKLTSLSPKFFESITIVDNPFPNIIPCITAMKKHMQQRAHKAAQREREETE